MCHGILEYQLYKYLRLEAFLHFDMLENDTGLDIQQTVWSLVYWMAYQCCLILHNIAIRVEQIEKNRQFK
jgi:hypothetical protein